LSFPQPSLAVEPSARARVNAVESMLVIGTGSAGYRHLMNARTLGVPELWVYSTGAGVRKEALPADIRVEGDLDRALMRGVRAVVIANPTSLHIETALRAAKAGCHLLIEKPLSHTIANIDDLDNEARARQLVLLTGYQLRFHPSLQQIRCWLQDGAIGEIVCANAVWGEYLPAWQPWRDYRTSYSARTDLGGGVLLTLSHPIDYLRWLLGEVTRVSAMTACRSGLELDVEDTAFVHLELENGAIVSLSLDYSQRPARHTLTIVGRDGVIQWDNASGVARLERLHRYTAYVPERFERNDLFIAEMNHFLDCIEGKCQPTCSIKDGERAVRVCLAAKESAELRRTIDV
jgi:predicted dehydrogenase